jgi:uncharacterized protein YlxW (UPF0749 family)
MSQKTKTYVLKVDRYTHQTGKGDTLKRTRYSKGDLIELTEAEAERLKGAVEEPGASQKREAERLQAEVDRLQAEQEAIESRISDAEDAAKRVESGKPAEDDGLEGQKVEELRVTAESAGLEPDAISGLKKAELIEAIRAQRTE